MPPSCPCCNGSGGGLEAEHRCPECSGSGVWRHADGTFRAPEEPDTYGEDPLGGSWS